MSANLYELINLTGETVLRSLLHGLLSGNTLLIEFKGRKTRRALSTPISYHADGDRVSYFRLDRKGQPIESDLIEAAKRLVLISIELSPSAD